MTEEMRAPRLIAVKWRRLGDTVLWTSAIDALRSWSPQARLDIAIPAAYAPLFADDPRVGQVYRLAKGELLTGAVKRWRRERYDWFLSFHASERTAWLALTSRAKGRLVHHHGRGGRRLFSDRPIVDAGRVMAAHERDVNVVRTLGWRGEAPTPRLFVGETRRAHGRELVARRLPEDGRPLVLMGPFASRPAKQWPLERYVELAALLRPRARVGIVYDAETAFAGYGPLRAALQREAVLIPTPKLDELLGLLPHAALYVGSDSGVKHMAAALNVPTVTLFGPESVGEWHPYPRDRHRVVRREVACRTNDPQPPEFAWCGVEVCPFASHACLQTITAREVADVVEQSLQGARPPE